MTKAFDLADLEAALKPVAAQTASAVAGALFSWISASLQLEAVSNPSFAIAIPVIGAIQPLVLAELAKLIPVAPAS